MLLGRDQERQRIEQVLARARSGISAKLGLVGEPGIGKTTLLAYAAECSAGMRLLRARGIESEAQVPFGSLLELVRPALPALESIPAPQAAALEGALALRPGADHGRFAVGAATLSLLAAYADQAPLAVLVDDAQWLDMSSAQALLFAVRRLVADPIAVLIASRADEPSLLDGADLPTLHLDGLTSEDAAKLVPGLAPETARVLHSATAGNPLALLELAATEQDMTLAPDGAPVLVSARITHAYLQQAGKLDPATREALVLCATCDVDDLPTLERAAAHLGIGLAALGPAESAGLVTLRAGTLEFRHPLVRSAIYADAPASLRRDAHRALAAVLPDRDIARRAWHLAAAASGTDETASVALEQAGIAGRDRSAYATAASAFERAARLTAKDERRAGLLRLSAEAIWLAGFTDRAVALVGEARSHTSDPALVVQLDELAGRIAARSGPVMAGHAILIASAKRADPHRPVGLVGEAAQACLYAAKPAEMLAAAAQARERLGVRPSVRARFLAAMTAGAAQTLGGDAAAGAQEIHAAVELAESAPELRDDLQLLPWLTLGPIFLRQTGAGRPLLEHALRTARTRAAVGVLPSLLNLIARDQAATDQWAVAGATYQEAIDLARESGQEAELSIALAGLAWLQARRGRQAECRSGAAEALSLSRILGADLCEIWVASALGELELGLGDAARAAGYFEQQQCLLDECGITDADLSPAAELVTAYTRMGADDKARRVAAEFTAAAEAKGQPWSRARALRGQGQLAPDADFAGYFEAALRLHERTPDAFEGARTQLAYGERLRRARNRVLAREQLQAAAATFERLDARSWADRAAAEFAATGETLRRRDPSTIEALTPQELQIALLLTAGRTTREAAAALFLSPKTVEYHLRHAYQKLGIHSRDALARALASQDPSGLDLDPGSGRSLSEPGR
jgi:DNA-binding CsgD family transcriptional regulator